MKKTVWFSLAAAAGIFFGAPARAADASAADAAAVGLEERGYAIQRLGADASPANIATLARALGDAEPCIAYAAAKELARIGGGPAADALLDAMNKGRTAAAGDAALDCARKRIDAGDPARGRALLEACRAAGPLPLRCAALAALARLDPAKNAAAVTAALTSAEPLENDAAADAVRTSAALAPAALAALPAAKGDAKARIVAALAAHAALPDVRKALTAALADPSPAVRLAALRAAPAARDPAAPAALWDACGRKGEEAAAAHIAFQAFALPAADAFLYEKMKTPAGRPLAIELLASRHHPALIDRLCDPAIYTDAATAKAAAGAFRTALQEPRLAQAFTFVFLSLPDALRAPFVSALASVVQQLPGGVKALPPIFEKLPAGARRGAMPVIASLQTPEAARLMGDELKTGDAEYRKELVREFAKWNRPAALDALVKIAKTDADGAVRILALRGALSLLDKKGTVNQAKKLEALAALAGAAERDAEKRLLYTRLQAKSCQKLAAARKKLAQDLNIDEDETPILAVNMGGPAVGRFLADTAADGEPFRTGEKIDCSEAVLPAPEAVYRTARFRNSAYRYQGFKPNAPYLLRLHIAELYHKKPGLRAGDAVVNGVKIVSALPSREFAKAFTVTKPITADAAGRIEIRFETARDLVMVNGFEILAKGKNAGVPKIAAFAPAAPAPAAARAAVKPPTPGKINVLLLTGMNNHDWKKTTPAICGLFARDARFAVTVVEDPWNMKPADIRGYDLLFSNWNTFGKRGDACKSHEWGPEMKAAFLDWIKKGGGFFVLHAGGSFFYDWKEFQTLIGGTWGKNTFHPHRQAFTVHIEDRGHPVTRGMEDFETFDEPWQRLTNANPGRRLLATMTISRQNRGTGNPETAAIAMTMGAGRCFNLVLGHNVRGITNPGCAKLLLRGAEWAATGDVK